MRSIGLWLEKGGSDQAEDLLTVEVSDISSCLRNRYVQFYRAGMYGQDREGLVKLGKSAVVGTSSEARAR